MKGKIWEDLRWIRDVIVNLKGWILILGFETVIKNINHFLEREENIMIVVSLNYTLKVLEVVI